MKIDAVSAVTRLTPDVISRMVYDAAAVGVGLVAGVVGWHAIFPGRGYAPFAQMLPWHVGFAIWAALLVVALNAAVGIYSRVRAAALSTKCLNLIFSASVTFSTIGFFLIASGHALLTVVAEIGIGWLTVCILMCAGRLIRERVRQEVTEEFTEVMSRERENSILVIGGGGYIGSALVPKLLAHGYKVLVLDKLYFGDGSISAFASHPDVEILRNDFRDVEALVRLIRRAGAIIHLGGLVGDPACAVDPELTIDINVTSTRLIAEIARAAGIRRFIYASSCSVYGASSDIVDEHSTFNPQSLYAQTKVASEAVLAELSNGGFSPTYLRFATIYGLSGRTRFDLVVNLLSAKAVRGGDITIFGSDQWRPFVHVDDVAEAIFLTLRAPLADIANRAFNVGSNEQNMTLLEVGERIRDIVPGSRIVETNENVDRRNYRVNFDRIRSTLGFRPRWSMEQGIRQVVEAVVSGRVGDYTAANHSNVRVLKEVGSQVFVQRYNSGWEPAYLDRRDPIQETGDPGEKPGAVAAQ
jgi:nucleoside-diphosphate-sugar epimerase